jgi:asparagine synthase (glutamine-hydrolysing)
MCGIAGFVDGAGADPVLLQRMCDAIRHRGPDEDGYLIDGAVGLGMRRLSIIDLASGRQPIFNEDGSVAVVFNGEIYNFPELRRRLEAKGHRFRSNTDTECIAHLYEEHGNGCVDHLRGMFAFALWDARSRRLLLGRDRVGKKPLFYRLSAGGIWFASELKALLQDPSFPRRVDPVAVHHYLTYQYVPAPWSIWEGVQKLPPAHVLSWTDGQAELTRYWRLRYTPKLRLTVPEAVEATRSLVREATRLRMISDRPIGAFLSGGVDSSIVVAAMAEQSPEPVKTFSIGFSEASYDERRYARLVAQRFGTDHHELVVRPSALEVLPTLVWHYDEPFADSSSIPSYYLARMTRTNVTVALNGDGGDESFAGYHRYLANLLASRVPMPARLGAAARRLLAPVADPRRPRTLPGRVSAMLGTLLTPPDERYARLMSYFTEEQKQAVYTSDLRGQLSGCSSYDLLAAAFADSDGPDLTDRMLAVDVLTYLPGDLLTKMDIATMANSLEARSPLLDHKLMEFAASLPASFKLRGQTGKWVLKQAARGWLPDDVIDRRKMGFGVPIGAWLRDELRELARDTLTDTTARQRGYFDPAAVRRLLDEHDAGHDRANRLWALLQLELWFRMFVDGRASVAPRPPALAG